ncbi:hypothetical protein BS78_04G329900 [Paspalum vaginatum]|nr:hypothetical protein BS78_04G329900 [Paspalum vaginatum]
MHYPRLAVSLPAAAAAALHPSFAALRRRSPSPSFLSTRPSSLLQCRSRPWIRTTALSDDDDLFTVDLDAASPEFESDSPWEGALVYRRDAAVHHLEYATTLERLGLGDLSSTGSIARAADMGLGLRGGGAQTPVLVSLDVTRRRGRLRLDGIVRTVITLGCFRCAEPALEGIFANFSLLLTEDPVEEPDVVDLGTVYEEDIAKGASVAGTLDEDDQDIDWDDCLHFPAADKEIDISKHIRDIIHLEITLDAVCSPGCKGLCLACGANLNSSSCTCCKENAQELKNVKGRGPLKDLLEPMQKR